MKKLFVFLTLMIFLAVGCTGLVPREAVSPQETVIFFSNSPIGLFPIKIPKGFFSNPDNLFWTEDEWGELQQQRQSAPEPESNKPNLTL